MAQVVDFNIFTSIPSSITNNPNTTGTSKQTVTQPTKGQGMPAPSGLSYGAATSNMYNLLGGNPLTVGSALGK